MIIVIDGDGAKYAEQLAILNGQRDQLGNTIAYLKTQLVSFEEELRKAYIIGNDANTNVAFAKQNLDAVNARWRE